MHVASLEHGWPAVALPAGAHVPLTASQYRLAAQSTVAEHLPPTCTEPGCPHVPAMHASPLAQSE
jgi:hypothetical protein